MTVDEFMDLPDPPGEFRLELRHGEVFELASPTFEHEIQVAWIHRLLAPVADLYGLSKDNLAYRASAEYNVRIADFAFVARERLGRLGQHRILPGAPDLIVEVVSPSNTVEDMEEKVQVSMGNGCREFWLVFPKLRTVRVATAQGTTTYRQGAAIPLTVFPGVSVQVDEIFNQRITG